MPVPRGSAAQGLGGEKESVIKICTVVLFIAKKAGSHPAHPPPRRTAWQGAEEEMAATWHGKARLGDMPDVSATAAMGSGRLGTKLGTAQAQTG